MTEEILGICKSINSNITMESDNLMDLEMIDSFGFLSLISQLEERFTIVLTEKDMDYNNFQSVQAIYKMLQAKLK